MNVNIVLFGEGGVGKTSIVNLLAGKAVAEPSHAWGSTSNSQRYTFQVNGKGFTIWDTIGLGESIPGVANRLGIIDKMGALIQQIQEQDGLDLLLFCIPGAGSRITERTIFNYRLFFEVLCDKRVPIAVVVTHLENEVKMEAWWERNKKYLGECGLEFSGHACVTGLLGHPKAAEGRAALQSLLLGFDHLERFTSPPTSDRSSSHLMRPLRKDEDKSRQLEQLLRDRTMRDSDNSFLADPEPLCCWCISWLTDWFKTMLGLAFPLRDDDVVVFLIGPSGSGKSTFVHTVIQVLSPDGVGPSLPPSTRSVQAFRCMLTQEARNTLRAGERTHIVFVDTPPFHANPKADAKAVEKMSAWLKQSKSRSTLVGTIYMYNIERDPTEDPIQRHLDTFASTFPGDFIARAFPMRLHCVFSRRDETTETSIANHKEKFEEQINALRPRVVNGWKPRWKTSVHDDLFVGDGRGVAWKAVEALFSSPGRW